MYHTRGAWEERDYQWALKCGMGERAADAYAKRRARNRRIDAGGWYGHSSIYGKSRSAEIKPKPVSRFSLVEL
jgi:hypothetical protein